MKKMMRNAGIAFLLIATVVSCSKDKDKKQDTEISAKIQNIVSLEVLDSLESIGLKINRGNHPPNIEGTYLVNPTTLVVPFGPQDPYEAGRVIQDHQFHFYDQVADDVKMDYTDNNSEHGEGIGSFISGSGNAFTLYAQLEGEARGIDVKTVFIVSGEVNDAGIKDMQFVAMLKEKNGDESNVILIPEGTGRIFKDGNQLADFTETMKALTQPAGKSSMFSTKK